MRSLSQPDVLKKAGLAALMTTLACVPRLMLWQGRPDDFWFVSLVLLWAVFVLWAFVFGWHALYSEKPVFQFPVPAKVWLLSTALGLCGALLLFFFVDPHFRKTTPQDYPDSIHRWAAMALFSLSFDQLFLCFAPFAFFIRLFHSRKAAFILTVLFGIFVMVLKVKNSPVPLPANLFLVLLITRLIVASLSVHLYLQGGVFAVWWWTLCLQLRHLAKVLDPGQP